jgi:hypothetical protein
VPASRKTGSVILPGEGGPTGQQTRCDELSQPLLVPSVVAGVDARVVLGLGFCGRASAKSVRIAQRCRSSMPSLPRAPVSTDSHITLDCGRADDEVSQSCVYRSRHCDIEVVALRGAVRRRGLLLSALGRAVRPRPINSNVASKRSKTSS